MFGFAPKLPISEEDRLWVNDGFRRLEHLLGRQRMVEARVILPSAEDFPDVYDKTPGAAALLFQRICGYMRVDRSTIDLEIFPDETEELRSMLPQWSGQAAGCAGFYTHDGSAGYEPGKRMLVAVRSTQLRDPHALVATMAHELGHVILLGGGLLNSTMRDHEPMTDLLTVFVGLGIFTANCASRFTQWQDDRRYGWSMQRQGYLAEEVYGYALAKFALERGEDKPEWIKHLSTNVRAYYKRSREWLAKNPDYVAREKPIT